MTTSNSARNARGFVMLLVLCVLTLIGVLVLTQLNIGATQVYGDVRQVEEERARGAAEACLTMAQAYINDYRASLEAAGAELPDGGVGATFSDFDGLLDPNHDPNDATLYRNDGDEFIPPFTTPVQVPAGATGAAHRWGMMPGGLGANTRCLVRIEDNSDDGFFSYGASYSVGWDATAEMDIEGCDLNTENGRPVRCPGVEVADRDNDGAVVINAIGLYPVPDGTPPAQAYASAHARVAIRRLTARDENEDSYGELIYATDSVQMVDTELCGLGGVQTTLLSMDPQSCACGDLRARSYAPATPILTGCNCAAACNAGTQSPLAVPPAPFVVGLAPLSPGAVPPVLDRSLYWEHTDRTTCSVYVREERAYLFDHTDTSARTQGGSAVTCLPGSHCTDRCGELVETVDSMSASGWGAPCTWNVAAGTVVCAAGQSPCWKPIADYGPGAPASMWLGGTPASATAHWSSGTGELAFVAAERIPNFKDPGARIGGATPVCGTPNVCRDCNGDRPTLRQSGTNVDTVDLLSDARFPSPLTLLVEAPGGSVRVRRTGQVVSGDPAPVPLSIITDARVDVDAEVSLLCSKCGAATVPNAAECNMMQLGYAAYDAAIRSSAACRINSNGVITGSVECRTIDMRGNTCVNGGLIADGTDLNCNGDRVSLCVRGDDVRVAEFVSTNGAVKVLPGRVAEFFIGISATGDVSIRDRTLRLGASIDSGGRVSLVNVGSIFVIDNMSGFTVKRQLTYTETTW